MQSRTNNSQARRTARLGICYPKGPEETPSPGSVSTRLDHYHTPTGTAPRRPMNHIFWITFLFLDNYQMIEVFYNAFNSHTNSLFFFFNVFYLVR